MTKLPNRDLLYLMDLLDDPNESIYATISETILSYGHTAIPYLESTRDTSLENLVRMRAKWLIHKIKIQSLYVELHNWAILDSKDLLKGYFIISKFQFPELDEARVMQKVEALKKSVWLELKEGMTPFEQAKVISKVFFEVNKFMCNKNSTVSPDSICLNAILNSGKGLSIGFMALYTGIAQQLGIPIYGIAMPETLYLSYVLADTSKGIDFKKDVRFYLNPFEAGVFYPIDEIKTQVEATYPDEVERFSGACTNADFIQQILNIMIFNFFMNGNHDKVDDIILLKEALYVE